MNKMKIFQAHKTSSYFAFVLQGKYGGGRVLIRVEHGKLTLLRPFDSQLLLLLLYSSNRSLHLTVRLSIWGGYYGCKLPILWGGGEGADGYSSIKGAQNHKTLKRLHTNTWLIYSILSISLYNTLIWCQTRIDIPSRRFHIFLGQQKHRGPPTSRCQKTKGKQKLKCVCVFVWG